MSVPKELLEAIKNYAQAKANYANRFIQSSNEDNRQYMMKQMCERGDEGTMLTESKYVLDYLMAKNLK